MGLVALVLVAVVMPWIISPLFGSVCVSSISMVLMIVRYGGCSFDLVVVAVRVSKRVACVFVAVVVMRCLRLIPVPVGLIVRGVCVRIAMVVRMDVGMIVAVIPVRVGMGGGGTFQTLPDE